MSWMEKSPPTNLLAVETARILEWNEVAGGGNHDYSPAKLDLQRELILEEAAEVIQAYDDKDRTNFLKEVLDLWVVSSYGAFLSDKKEYLKPFHQGRPASLKEAIDDIREVLGNPYSYTVSLSMVYKSRDLLEVVNADVVGALRAVNASNFSKFCRECDPDAVVEQLTEDYKGRYTGITWCKYSDLYIFKDERGKVLKGPYYTEVSLNKFLPSESL